MLSHNRSLPFAPPAHVQHLNEILSTGSSNPRSSLHPRQPCWNHDRLTPNDLSCVRNNGKQNSALSAADGNSALQHDCDTICQELGHTDSVGFSAQHSTITYFDTSINTQAQATMPPSSRQWMSKASQDARDLRIELRNFHRGRMQLCPRSPVLTANFNLVAHKQIMAAARKRKKDRKLYYDMQTAERRQAEQRRTFPLPPPAIRPAFGGKEFSTNNASVLWYPTVFSPVFWKGKEGLVSEWPTQSEMKYEGNERIATDKLHSRFPPLPRVVGNETVNWQHRAWIKSYPFDDFYPTYGELDIKMRMVRIADSEFDDEEGKEAVGEELMAMMENQDIW